MFWFANTRKRSEKPARQRHRPTRLRLEWLEDRRLLCNLGPGSLDETFDTDGKVTADFGAVDYANAVAIQPDGKIVAAGSSGSDFAVARYNADGTLDNTFSGDGKATTAFARPAGATAVLIQPDSKIVAVGTHGVTNGQQNDDFALVRYNADGSLDKTFGSGGKLTTAFSPGSEDSARDAVLQPDGKIVAVGISSGKFALARYNANGSLDSSFGTRGKVVTDITTGFGQDQDRAYGVVFQPDGKIVVAGEFGTGLGVAVARYATNGSLDATFGTGGIVTTVVNGGFAKARDIAIQADGKLVVGGVIDVPTRGDDDMLVLRYNTNGTLDTTFDADGMVVFDGADDESALAIAIQGDGKILAGGYKSGFPAVPGTNFELVRLNTNGSLDSTFGSGGIVLTDFGQSDRIHAMALDADGKVVAVGISALSSTDSDFALARYCP